MLVGAYTLLRKDDVRVDPLLNVGSPRWKAFPDLPNVPFPILGGGVLTYEAVRFFEDRWRVNEGDDSALRPPIWPAKPAMFRICVNIRSRMRPGLAPAAETRAPLDERLRSPTSVILPLRVIVSVLVSIFAGIAAPTDPAALGAFAAISAGGRAMRRWTCSISRGAPSTSSATPVRRRACSRSAPSPVPA